MDFNQILDEHGLAVVIIFILFAAISWFARWFFNNYTANLDTQFSELLREIAEVKEEIIDNNNKLYGITEKLIANQRLIGEDVNALESSLDTLLKFINKNGSK
jgi:predicted PurR-regulated permease PerM